MKANNIKVFEHQRLRVGEDGFREDHFKNLVLFNEKNGDQFFTVGLNRIKFSSYVGVLQVGDLTIEVLPKVDSGQDKNKWHQALLTMLYECKYIRLHSLTDASLKLRSASLIDLYFDAFLSEVQQLVHMGLIKGYRKVEENLKVLKGKIQFSQHLTKNLIHKERFYARHEVYDYNMVFNRILKKALNILLSIVSNPGFINRAKRLLYYFEEITVDSINTHTFERLRFGRKTKPYRYAVNLAKLIILRYNPDVKTGKNNVLAILFDMNQLFEEYVYRLLKKEESSWALYDLTILRQFSKPFWQGRKIRPDIVLNYIERNKEEDGETVKRKIIIDTKWKELHQYMPSDDDLKQMYVYNLHMDADRSILLYPKIDLDTDVPKFFDTSDSVNKEHSCQIYFAELFDSNGYSNPDFSHVVIKGVLTE